MRDRANLWFLFRQLLVRELSARYRATTLGLLWVILQPLLMLAIYTLVFSGIFKVRWGGEGSSASFALVLFAGLIVFNFFADVFVSSPTAVSSQPNYVKKVVFPVALLAAVRVATAAVPALAGLVLLCLAQWLMAQPPSPWFLLAPLVLVAMAPMLLGVSWLMSGLGVYLQDITQVAGVVVSMLLFLSPIFFPASAMPAEVRFLVDFNPLVAPMEQLRALTVQGQAADFTGLALYFFLSCVFAALAYRLFQRLSKGFADVL
ncbi:ABC transporter permease [Lysobacter sp. P5_B9]